MSSRVVYILLSVAVVLVSCVKTEKKQADEKAAFQIDSVSAAGVQRMQVSSTEQDVKFRDKDYHILIQRVPADSMSVVKNEAGDSYVDNQITLRITRGKGEKVFSRTFNKHSFSDWVDADFLSKSILEGMVFDKTTEKGIVLAASVSFPQTDLYVPISLTITPDGKMTMEKEELMDENFSEQPVL